MILNERERDDSARGLAKRNSSLIDADDKRTLTNSITWQGELL